MDKAQVIKIQMEALGWMYAEACNMLDRGEDLRKVPVPEIIDRFHRAFDKNCDTCSITGLLCPIKDEQSPSFPCKHWKD